MEVRASRVYTPATLQLAIIHRVGQETCEKVVADI